MRPGRLPGTLESGALYRGSSTGPARPLRRVSCRGRWNRHRRVDPQSRGVLRTVGLKPTYGLVSRYGVNSELVHVRPLRPLTWTVEDCAIMLQAIAGYDARDGGSIHCTVPDYRAAFTPDLRGLRVGVIRHFWEEDLKSRTKSQVRWNRQWTSCASWARAPTRFACVLYRTIRTSR